MIIEKANTEYGTCRIPVLVMTNNESLLGCYECRKDYSDLAEIDLKIIRSVDKGETWQTVKLIKGLGQTLNNPVFIVKGGVIHFLYCENYTRLFYSKSEDDGLTFSSPKELTGVLTDSGFNYTVAAVGPSHGIVHKGNLLVPIWFALNKENPLAHRPSFISVLYSSDDGMTWKLGETIGEGLFVNPSECSMASDGKDKVLISIRNENGGHEHNFRGFGESETGYSGWRSVVLRQDMRDCICQGSVYFENGKFYHSNCIGQNRTDLTLKVSSDEFSTWQSFLVDTIGGYSDLAVKDGVAYILYERNPNEDGLYFKKIKVVF